MMEGLMQSDNGATAAAEAGIRPKARRPRLTAREHYDLAEQVRVDQIVDEVVKVEKLLNDRLPKNSRIRNTAHWLKVYAVQFQDALNADYVEAGHHDGRSPLPYDKPLQRPEKATIPMFGSEFIPEVVKSGNEAG